MPEADINFRLTATGARQVESSFSRVGRSIKRLAAVAGIAIGINKAFDTFVTQSFHIAAGYEQISVSMENFLGSGQETVKMLGAIEEKAAKTPFRFTELADTSKKLLAFGISAEKVLPTLGSLGDLAAGTGNRIQEIGEIYGKAAVQGRLFAEDINQFTGRGIPIIQELAKQFNVADSQVKKLVETGQVGFSNLEKAFADMTAEGGKFFNLTARQSETAAGKLSTLQDNFEKLQREIGKKLLPIATKAFDDITRSLQRVFLGMNDVEGGSKQLDEVFMALKGATSGLSSLFIALKDAMLGVNDAFDFFAAPFKAIFGEASDSVRKFSKNAKELESQVFFELQKRLKATDEQMRDFRGSLGDFTVDINKPVKDAFDSLVNRFAKWQQGTKATAEETKTLKDMLGEGGGLGGKAKFAAGSIGEFEERIRALNDEIKNATDAGTFDQLTRQIEALQLGINTIEFGSQAEKLRLFVEAAREITGPEASILPSTDEIRATWMEYDSGAAMARKRTEDLAASMVRLKEEFKEFGKDQMISFAQNVGFAFGQAIAGTDSLQDALAKLALEVISTGLRYGGLALTKMAFQAGFPAGIPLLVGGLALLGASGVAAGVGSGIGQSSQVPNAPALPTAGTVTAAASSPYTGDNGNAAPPIIQIMIDGEDVAYQYQRINRKINRRAV